MVPVKDLHRLAPYCGYMRIISYEYQFTVDIHIHFLKNLMSDSIQASIHMVT